MRTKRILAGACPLLLLLAAGCGEDGNPTGPDDDGNGAVTGTIQLTTSSSGAQPDPDGYSFQVDGGPEAVIGENDTASVTLAAGLHNVSLVGLSRNCQVTDGASRSIIVTEGQTSLVSFEVRCPSTVYDRIVFSSDRSGTDELYVMDPNGNGVEMLLVAGQATQPAVSPDGTSIAYTFLNDEIWAADADGQNRRQLTDDGSRAAWSPDGSRIAFQSSRAGNWEIWVMNADGSDQTDLTLTASVDDEGPSWSPDGTKIAYVRSDGSGSDIWVINADGTSKTELAGNAGDETDPAWSPDGTQIAYASTRVRPIDSIPSGDYEIHVINADGTNDRFVTNNTAQDRFPTWSADGSQIAFSGDVSGNYEVYVMPAGGGTPVNVTGNAADDLTWPQSWAR